MLKYFFGFLILLLSYSQFALGAESFQMESEKYLFVGNQGVGKSTIINAFMGKNVAKSGISLGGAVTENFQSYKFSDKELFIDTPGLDGKKESAEQIEKALKLGGKYHIFFVINTCCLILHYEEILSMNLMLDAINCKDVKFNIIINKVEQEELKFIRENSYVLSDLLFIINSSKYKTNNIYLVPLDSDLHDCVKGFFDADDSLKKFVLDDSLSMSIAKEDIVPIKL